MRQRKVDSSFHFICLYLDCGWKAEVRLNLVFRTDMFCCRTEQFPDLGGELGTTDRQDVLGTHETENMLDQELILGLQTAMNLWILNDRLLLLI